MRRRTDVEAIAKKLAKRWRAGATYMELASEFGVHWQTVRKYVRGSMSELGNRRAVLKHQRLMGSRFGLKYGQGQESLTKYRPGAPRGYAARRMVKIGTVRMRYSRNNRGRLVPQYRVIKVADLPMQSGTNWKRLAAYLWEKVHGPVPAGHFVVHVDGDKLNDDLANLEAVPVARLWEHSRRVKSDRFVMTDASRRRLSRQRREYLTIRAGLKRTAG